MILVVEDEPLIRTFAVAGLVDAGFVVIEAQSGGEALDILQTRAGSIHAVFTDIHMPGPWDGLALAREIVRCWPWVHLLVASGLGRPAEEELPPRCRFLPKPYELENVVRRLHQMIDPP